MAAVDQRTKGNAKHLHQPGRGLIFNSSIIKLLMEGASILLHWFSHANTNAYQLIPLENERMS